MNIVCIDTSWASITITAQGKEGIFTSIFTPSKARHSAILIPALEKAVKEAGFSVNETDILVCPQGPGGFTGLRLAYSTAKAIQLQTNAQFFCVSILQALCHKYGEESQFLSIIDAKRDCFYVQAFKNKKPVSEALDISAQEALKLIDKDKKTIICGFGTKKFKEDMAKEDMAFKSDNFTFMEADKEISSKILLDCFTAGQNCIKVEDHEGPVYIRKSDAEY
ncbi:MULTISPECIES: tRNA (adenosine(37)-N6)-threonylcarbamoyltransferase complex dimerization subunit type 1 TsaB [unclassified Treponema]|uniref:tRNA (adenosine(37)-N6)-threonylcarbamoyltransferase complex dimerization subunit type 1 TsaB n=1 Tax=unclassified Treponema TaxID=2638727 RepID=UPI0020A4A9BB|nr:MULTISPECIES: tRNA (adenosine(37)-N6)-threonylcarbamoyltransferase complex dimerization subunit type 1 TsaB [unclassified Treponema]UTC68155.1 tRNA (adenosine(37)-N6)-threonylcarbamoyltransferase complex dimerization subunit type 1 TsaB [Treponema sp. OMZ 789]UTC70877.1 tRNA (adenosine(37)-N6)-threonylcarbamoyltransferase complex dimerization subunit type 1 TsaB [Treponema sp. OMZ 790]UTC73617.1 tRNA (adenosine(37)-N6)-threonylcarbamoyltransferase complex dimerization subunit type 1 TsaB [Tre